MKKLLAIWYILCGHGVIYNVVFNGEIRLVVSRRVNILNTEIASVGGIHTIYEVGNASD